MIMSLLKFYNGKINNSNNNNNNKNISNESLKQKCKIKLRSYA